MRACLFRLSKTLLSVPAAKRLIARVHRAVLVQLTGIIISRHAPSGVMGDHIHRKGGSDGILSLHVYEHAAQLRWRLANL